jgi:glutamate-1-semialdehyde 2,1-aminomutase
MRNGISFGASTPAEAELAELVISAFPQMQRVRFVSSGTEATMSAIRLARAYTKRKYIVKFEGCYHGHADALLVKAGSGIATLGIPGSAGVPEEFTQFTLALPFNDTDALEEAFKKKFRHQIACVIMEPVVGNMGCVPPARGYLEALRAITANNGTLLIFDEVMTGFRLAFGGAQEIYSIRPDLTTLGKIIGGGLPVGAYGGPSQIMDLVAPLGPMYQAGTLSGNPLAMAAGYATLRYLRDHKEIYKQLDQRSGDLVTGVASAAEEAGIPMTHNRVGSMFTWFFTPGPVTDWNSAAKSDTEAFGRFFRSMLDSGVYLPPSQFEAAFLSAAHTAEDIEQTISAAKQAFAVVHA